ncbi:MAG: HAMP domain-containing histidine kinase [Bdellovibrionales bacterium]|nr:HAMP domain-containing histidine kinase [Bdellovibrionales bacterium]
MTLVTSSTDRVSVLSLRSRTLVFLVALSLLSIVSVFLFWDSQERLNRAATQIQSVLIPSRRLIEQARTEVDLQIQELTILHRETQATPQDLARLRLSPGVKSLLTLQSAAHFPAVLLPLFKPWAELAASYETRILGMKSFSEAIPLLRDLRQKTILLHRAVDRELSVQLLTVTQGGREHLVWGFAASLLTFICGIVFVFLVRQWTLPLVHLRDWINENTRNPRTSLLSAVPPRSVLGSGLLSPPAEVQDLVESLRTLLHRLRSLGEELDTRTQRTAENERAVGTLFSALHHLTRHNEKLLAELIKRERLASMGEMAAQLAHEIRNPLNSLNLKLEMLREELAPEQQGQLDRVLVEIDRLDALTESHLRTTRSVLKGSIAAPPEPQASRLEDIADSVLDTLRPELNGRGIFVQRSVSEEKIKTYIPANILKAALMNLIKNSAEALKDADPKVIRLAISRDGEGWRMAVADTGSGMPSELLRGPIESFRTTKPDGSGLGLVTSEKMLAPYGVTLKIQSPAGPFATEVSLVAPPEAAARKSERPVLNLEAKESAT